MRFVQSVTWKTRDYEPLLVDGFQTNSVNPLQPQLFLRIKTVWFKINFAEAL